MFHKWIFKIGQGWRNPSINNWLIFLKKSEKWSLDELEKYQFKKLKEILQFAYQYSPYYKEVFNQNNVHPDDLKTLKDIVKFPVLSKEDLIQKNNIIHTNYKFKKQFKATTSGSSGNSLAFMRDEKADSFNRASIFRGYTWYDVHPWERNGYFWGFNFSRLQILKLQLFDALQNRFRVFSYEEKAFLRFVRKLQHAKYLHGYSSMIFEAAKIINTKGLKKPGNLKMIKGTSEKIFDSYQSEVKKAFGIPVISEYGATESGIIAFECPEGHMHLNMEGVIVEEENNEILVTNIQMKSFPIIRYKLGDYIELAPRDFKCACGRKHLVLQEVTGRIGENVYGYKNVYPSLYFYYIFKNLSKKYQLALTYKVIQKVKGELIFYIEEVLDDTSLERVKSEIVKYFKTDVKFQVITCFKKEMTNSKTKSFISYI